MSVDVALTSDELAALAGPSTVRSYAVYDTISGNTVATAQVTGTITYPLTSLEVTGTSAGWADIAPRQTVFIGSTPGGFERGIYRVRKAGTSTTIEIMAIGINDAGAITIANRSSVIQAGDYITVLNRFDPFGVFPRIDYSGTGTDATIYEDWDDAYSDFNEFPPPIINVFIAGKPSNYATHVYGDTSATFDIDLEIILWPTSSSATYTITLPSGITLNSGSLTGSSLTPSINVTADHSADSYTILFEATEDNGSTWTSERKIWVKSNTYPPLSLVRIESDAVDRTGARMTITLNNLQGLPAGSMVHVFDMAAWNGDDVPSAATSFTGYVVRRRETSQDGTANVSLDLVGPMGILEKIGSQSQIMTATSSSPANWQELAIDLSYLDFIIWWIVASRASGFLQMFNWTSFGLTNTQRRMSAWRIDEGTLLSQVKGQARRILGGNIGCDASGEFMLRRRVSNIPTTDRTSIPVRAALTSSNVSSVDMGAETRPNLRRIRGEAFYSDAVTDTPVWADAPILPGQGSREDKADKLIVDSAGDLLVDIGHEYAAQNNPYPNGSITIKKNWAVIKPAQMLRLSLTIYGPYRYDEATWTNYVLPTQVTRVHNPDGTIDTKIEWELETAGSTGVNVPIDPPDPTTYNSPYASIPFATIPAWRSTNPNPAGTRAGARVIPKTSAVVFDGTSTKAYYTTNFNGVVRRKEITPTLPSGYTIRHGTLRPNSLVGYLLISDGTNSKVVHYPDISKATRTSGWTIGATVAGEYKLLRTNAVAGDVMIYSPGVPGNGITLDTVGGDWRATLDMTIGKCGFDNSANSRNTDGLSGGDWIAGTGWRTSTKSATPVSPTKYSRGLGIAWGGTDPLDVLPAFDLKTAVYTYAFVSGTASSPPLTYSIDYNAVTPDYGNAALSTGTYTPSLSYGSGTHVNSGKIGIFINAETDGQANADALYTLTHSKIVYTGSGTNPFTGKDTPSIAADVRFSSNHGSTFGSAISIGSSAGEIAGFDVQQSGGNSFAAADGEITRATSLGGAYSTYYSSLGSAQAICIVVPWYVYNSLTGLNNGSNPDIVVGLSAADGSGRTAIWIEGGATPGTVHNIPLSGAVFGSANAMTTFKGKNLAMLSASHHLLTSVNAGASSVDRGDVGTDTWIRVRRNANTPGELAIAGSGVEKYSADFGVTKANKTLPSPSDLVFCEFYG